jgi:hypothetical protein
MSKPASMYKHFYPKRVGEANEIPARPRRDATPVAVLPSSSVAGMDLKLYEARIFQTNLLQQF